MPHAVWDNGKLSYTAKDTKSSQCNHVTDNNKKTNGNSKPPLEDTNHTNASGQSPKLAHDNNGTECLKIAKKSMKVKEVEKTDYLDSGVSLESDKCDLKTLMCKDDDSYFEKINKQELKTEKEEKSELQYSEDEKPSGHLDSKANAAMDVPTELESAYAYKEDIQGVNKCSEGDETRANKTEDDSGDELDDHENTADTINESVTPEPVCDSPQATQRSHISEEDSEMPIVEPTECKMPPIDNAKFVITVVKAPFKQQLHEPIVYPPAVETKFSDSLLPSHGTSYLSLKALLNDKLLGDQLSEEQPIALAVNLKHPVNIASRPDTADASAFLTAEKLQVGGSIYPYFSALAGPAGECPEEISNGSSEPQDCGDNNDDTILEGSVSDHTSFWSGFSDAFNLHTY